MAEFVMLMQEYKRLCDSQETCKDCVLVKLASNAVCCEVAIVKCPEEAERIIMQWAKENPSTKGDRMILIEGMDKPENCMVCPFKDADEDCIFRKEETSKIDNFYKMYLGCPLKEVQG